MVHFADHVPDAHVRVQFAANAVELDAPCRSLRFSGDFGITAPHEARFFGTVTDADARALPASLQVQTLEGGAAGLTVTMRDADGRVLLGPVTLQRVQQQAAPARR